MKKAVFIIVSAVLIAGAFFLYKKHAQKPATVYDTVTVGRGAIKIDVTATGTIQPVNVVSIGTQVSGTIEKVFVDYNSRVKKGDLIAQLETFTLLENLKEAEAVLTDMKSKLVYARLNALRNKELFESNYIAKYEWEEAEMAAVTAKANYDKAVAQVKIAKKNLGYANIVSPVSGTIITKKVEEGQTVASSFQTPELFTIAEDLTKMQIEANVSEADIGMIKAGQIVDFTVDAYPTDAFQGTVSQVRLQPTEDSNVVMYTVVVSISNNDLKLMPGMTAYITVNVVEKQNVLRLQNMAMQFKPYAGNATPSRNKSNIERTKIKMNRQNLRPDEAIVYVLQNKEPVARKIKKGLSNLLFTEILDGLAEGDTVVMEDLTPEHVLINRKDQGHP